MHVHSFKEITEHFDFETLRFSRDEILHIFECPCGFTLIEKKRPVRSLSQKKMTIYTVIRKTDPNQVRLQAFPNPDMKTRGSRA